MSKSGAKKPLHVRIFRITLAVVAPLILLSLSISPIIQTLSQSSGSETGSHQSQMATERLRQEAEGYEAVIEREPDNLVALRGLTNLYLQLGEYQKAIDPLSRIVELQPEDGSSTMMLGSLLLQTGAGERAVDLFEPLYAEQPNNPALLDGLVRSYLLADQTREAADLLTERLEESPDNRDLQIQLARVYRQSNRGDEAIAIYDQMIAQDAEDFVPVLEKAVALSQGAGEDVEQEEIDSLFDRAISLAPAEQQPQVEQLKTLYGQLGSVNTLNAEMQEETAEASEETAMEESEASVDPEAAQ